MSMINSINDISVPLEKGLNIAGYIPVVGTISAVVRATIAKVQMTVGAVMAGLNYLGSILARDPQRQQELEKRAVKSLEFVGHGVLNAIRAIFEFVPFVSLVTCLPYDLYGRKPLVYTSYPEFA